MTWRFGSPARGGACSINPEYNNFIVGETGRCNIPLDQCPYLRTIIELNDNKLETHHRITPYTKGISPRLKRILGLK